MIDAASEERIRTATAPKESRMTGGRIAVYVPDHPAANNRGYILRSRHVMEQVLGRRLDRHENVHHRNGDKQDDRAENLEVLSTAEHTSLHHRLGGIGRKRRLDYDRIAAFMADGYGYRRIARFIDEPLSSVRYACRVLRRTEDH